MTSSKYELVYGGSGSISNQDGRLILKNICLSLTSIFENHNNNCKVLILFKSLGLLEDLECNELFTTCSSVIWTEKFVALLKHRADVCKALNHLLNLKNDPDLSNYQANIRRAFENVPGLPKKLTVIDNSSIQSQSSQQMVPTPSLPHNDSSVSITIESNLLSASTGNNNNKSRRPCRSESRCWNWTRYSSVSDFVKKNPKMTGCIFVLAVVAVIMGLFLDIFVLANYVNNSNSNIITPAVGKKTAAIDLNHVGITNYTTTNPLWFSQSKALEESNNSETTTTPLKAFGIVTETITDNNRNEKVVPIATEDEESSTTAAAIITSTNSQNETLGFPKTNRNETFQGQQLYINTPIDIKQKTLKICDPNFKTTLVLNVEDHYEWHDVEIDCGSRVSNVKIEGYPSLKNIDQILIQTPNITTLQVQCDKISMRNTGFPDKSTKVELLKLKSLDLFSGNAASDCNDALLYFADNVRYVKLRKLNIHGISVTDNNKPEVYRIMSKMSSSSLLEINLNDIIMQTFLNITSRTRTLSFSKFQLKLHNSSSSSSVDEQTELATKTVTNFLNTAKYLKDFSTNVPFPDRQMPHVLTQLEKLRIQKMHAIIQMKEGRTQLSFKFLINLKRLEKLDLELIDWKNINGSSSNPYMLLKDFNSLPQSLKEFKVSTNFEAKAQGTHVPCRSFIVSKNNKGGMSIEFYACSDCDNMNECMRKQ